MTAIELNMTVGEAEVTAHWVVNGSTAQLRPNALQLLLGDDGRSAKSCWKQHSQVCNTVVRPHLFSTSQRTEGIQKVVGPVPRALQVLQT